jgi:uncharacterized membrane protein
VATVTQSIDLDVPIRMAYDQWTQFEEFPRFMEGIREVRRLDDVHLHWVAEIGGRVAQWDAEITEQRPDECVAWRSTSGKQNSGVVRFEPLGTEQTRITVEIEHDPDGMLESVGAAVGADDRRVRRELERFRDLLEDRDASSDAWRARIGEGNVRPEPASPGMD